MGIDWCARHHHHRTAPHHPESVDHHHGIPENAAREWNENGMNGNAGGGGGGLAAPLTPIEISSNSSHHQNIRHIFA